MTYAVYDYGTIQGTWAMVRTVGDAGSGRMAELAMHRNDKAGAPGAMSLETAETRMTEKFNTMDTDGDGMISQAEFAEATMPKPPAPAPVSEDQSIRAILEGILAQLQTLNASEAAVTEAAPVVETGNTVAAEAAPLTSAAQAAEAAKVIGAAEAAAEALDEPLGIESKDSAETVVEIVETAPAAAAEDVALATDQNEAAIIATAVTETATEEDVEGQFETLIDLLEDGEETGNYSTRLSDFVENLYVDVQTILDAA
ncbi:MAG: EF-hand domain-containing protein [Pseudomonadota bacterium]